MSKSILIHQSDMVTSVQDSDYYPPNSAKSHSSTQASTRENLALREEDSETFPPYTYNRNPLSEEEIVGYKTEMEDFRRQGNEYYELDNLDQALQCYRQAVMLNNQVGKFLHKDREKFLKSCCRSPSVSPSTSSSSSSNSMQTKMYTPLFDRNYDEYPLRDHFKLLDQQNSIFWDSIAACYLLQDKPEDCIDACTTALDLTPGYSNVRLRRASANIIMAELKKDKRDICIFDSSHLDDAFQDLFYLQNNEPDFQSETVKGMLGRAHELAHGNDQILPILNSFNTPALSKLKLGYNNVGCMSPP